MPASRSRTEHWSDCLRKIQERGGAIEISINRRPGTPSPNQGDRGEGGGTVLLDGADIVWRVRLLAITPTELIVEPPAAFGQSLDLDAGIALIGAMTIGQNRWMFHTKTLGSRPGSMGRVLALALPTGVERCTRRSFYRISTADLNLPQVQMWPLLDPTTVGAAEAANRLAIQDRLRNAGVQMPASDDPESLLLPEVGPLFKGTLVNMSGGGLGIRISRQDAGAVERKPFFWLRVDLRPQIPAPVAVTCRLAHTHIDSTQALYAGMAFDFAFNPEHRRFVLGVFADYIAHLQTGQRAAA